jgi:hypothetical protein
MRHEGQKSFLSLLSDLLLFFVHLELLLHQALQFVFTWIDLRELVFFKVLGKVFFT